ncbi:DVU0298 family protein [Fibrobacterota bacterium]
MTSQGPGSIKGRIKKLLGSEQFRDQLDTLESFPPLKTVNSLFPFLCSSEKAVKWHSVTVMGIMVSRLVVQDFEKARNVMRKLIWMLSEESGNIGWGAPEAMAEIMARDRQMAREYSSILVSFMMEEGNYLEFEPLQKGVLWGIGRLAEADAKLLTSHGAGEYLLPYLESSDSEIKGLAVRAAGLLKFEGARRYIQKLVDDKEPIEIYENGRFVTVAVGELVEELLRVLG